MDDDLDPCGCSFPFLLEDEILYGCTDPEFKCATEVDTNHVPVGPLKDCESSCPIQKSQKSSGGKTATLTEGEKVIKKTYQKPMETTLELKKSFKLCAHIYTLTLEISNLHDPENITSLEWKILCGIPVLPETWLLEYNPLLRPSENLEIAISIPQGDFLPAIPVLRVWKLGGTPIAIDITKSDKIETVSFQPLVDGENCEDCSYECAIFEQFGLGDFAISKGITINITISIGVETSYGGFFGFALDISNPLSTIEVNSETCETNFEDLQMLDTTTGEVVEITVPKWQYRWIESFATLEGPVFVKLQYKFPANPRIVIDMNSVNGVWYLPRNAIPVFTISFYKGTAKKIQYQLNSTTTDTVLEPCHIDWPEGVASGKVSFVIDKCEELLVRNMTFLVIPTKDFF